MHYLLEVKKVSKSYPKASSKQKGIVTQCAVNVQEDGLELADKVLKNLSFELKTGEIVSFLGENGSGKSTLLRLIAALDTPTEGSIFFENTDLKMYSEALVKGHPEIKLVHQNFQLFPKSTLAENLNYALRYQLPGERKLEFDALVTLLELEDVLDHLPEQVSGGQQQRMALAMALAQKPRLLLMDEPFSNLDRFQRDKLRHIIKQLHKKKKIAIVIVTHDYEDALGLSDKIYVLRNGEILESGTPDELYLKPRHAYTAQITGPVSMLDGSLARLAGIETKENTSLYFVRPEQWKIAEEGLEAVVKDNFYLGHGYFFKAIFKKTSIVGYHTKPLAVGKAVFLKAEV